LEDIMKLGLIMGALALALGAVACGGNGSLVSGGCDPDDPQCVPPPSGGSSSGGTSHDSGVTVNEAGSVEAGVDASDASRGSNADSGSSSGSSSGGSGSSSSGSGGAEAGSGAGVCIPGNACGGLWECTDDCYTGKCCVLDCSCTDPSGATGTLDCSLTCP
jgi:hypothetical protein